MIRQITYYRERVGYKNVCRSGEIVEAVIFNTPELTYKYHIFILHNGKRIKKLYRRSLHGAKKTALRFLQQPDGEGGQVFFDGALTDFIAVYVGGVKRSVPARMAIPVRSSYERGRA